MRSLFIRQFFTTAMLLLISFLLTGAAFLMLSNRYILSEKQETLRSNAETVAHSAMAYQTSGELEDNWDFRMNITSTARAANEHIMICDTEGVVITCSDEEFKCQHIGMQIEDSIINQLENDGSYFAITRLGGVYETEHYVVGELISDARGVDTLGMVFVSSDVSSFVALNRSLKSTFIVVAMIVLIVAFFFTTYASQKQTKPLIDMANAARQFAHGQLDVRVNYDERQDEIGELSQAFNAMAESLEHSEKMRREFVSNVSHELKTPMTTISGFVDGILDGTIPPEKEREYLKIISAETARLSRLVRTMLDVSRIQEQENKVQKQAFDISELALRTLLSFEQKVNEKSLKVKTDLPHDPLIVMGEPDSINRVIYNLLDNAIKFANNEGTIEMKAVRKGGKALVSISNTGSTIPAEQQALIFDRFHKADASRSADRDGVGLGLYIVKTILNNHGEDIKVHSAGGITTFTFTMELKKNSEHLQNKKNQ